MKSPVNEYGALLRNLRDELPYITKYMDRNDDLERLHFNKFISILWCIHRGVITIPIIRFSIHTATKLSSIY